MGGTGGAQPPQRLRGQSYSIRAGLDAVGPLAAEDFLLFRWPTSPGCGAKR